VFTNAQAISHHGEVVRHASVTECIGLYLIAIPATGALNVHRDVVDIDNLQLMLARSALTIGKIN
jgi:hypothetical protein